MPQPLPEGRSLGCPRWASPSQGASTRRWAARFLLAPLLALGQAAHLSVHGFSVLSVSFGILDPAGVEGFEPPSSGFGDRRSSQLELHPFWVLDGVLIIRTLLPQCKPRMDRSHQAAARLRAIKTTAAAAVAATKAGARFLRESVPSLPTGTGAGTGSSSLAMTSPTNPLGAG